MQHLKVGHRAEAEERSREIIKPLRSNPVAKLRLPVPPPLFHNVSSGRLCPQARTGRQHLRLTYASLSSAVLTHEPCGQDRSITCRFDRGFTLRTWLERRDRAAAGARKTQGDQRCPVDDRSSRQRSERGALGTQARPSGGKSRGFEPLAAQQEEHCWRRSLRSLPLSLAL
jgi:hypothetical protein